MKMENRRAGLSSSMMASIKAKWAITRLHESTEMSYLAPSAERLVSSPKRRKMNAGPEMLEAISIHGDIRTDLLPLREFFIDTFALMVCVDLIGAIILFVALSVFG